MAASLRTPHRLCNPGCLGASPEAARQAGSRSCRLATGAHRAGCVQKPSTASWQSSSSSTWAGTCSLVFQDWARSGLKVGECQLGYGGGENVVSCIKVAHCRGPGISVTTLLCLCKGWRSKPPFVFTQNRNSQAPRKLAEW
jgi:hypothetical protein